MNQTAISEERAFAELAQHLRDRRDELEQSILTRAQAIADPADTGDPEYASGFRAATFAALDYGLAAIERPAEGVPPVPPALLVQARLAARCGVSLDIVLRRYFAGFALMGDFVLQAAKQVSGLEDASLEHLLRDQAASFDRLIVAVSEEHSQERERRLRSPERRRVDRIKSLLDGESADSSELGYQLDCHHLAIVARGEGAAAALRELATPLGSRLLLARPDPRTAWSWLGSRRPISIQDLLRGRTLDGWPRGLSLAVGEPGHGLHGWRLTHRQAAAALAVALRADQRCVAYRQVAVEASLLGDDLLATSLRQAYLDPLSREREGGAMLRQTLRAYFSACRNVSSAAAALGISRRTVSNRLQVAEQLLGRPLSACAAETEMALRLDALEDASLDTPFPEPDTAAFAQ